jgi:hypothetical protein
MEIHMNDDHNVGADESALQTAKRKLDPKAMIIMVAFIGGLLLLVALNMN